jgi:hypothetical protein
MRFKDNREKKCTDIVHYFVDVVVVRLVDVDIFFDLLGLSI